jgi:hypothetical protein
VQNGHRHMGAVFLEQAGHPQLFCNHTGTHNFIQLRS